ncbi:universal stress protein [Microvirga terricola]|uniref:Universal stress protein n=1 Tax=Microvirga terricola TaxID=2719797 RepID=A0ABX0V5Q5_9HYPH|nr:universal stress protein [Microvirga terricola]NIX75052.1 universal stress protein [Microvirga terricola]
MTLQNLKSILVGFNPEDKAPSSALRYALSLASQAGAHVSVCSLTPEMTITHAFVSDVAAGLVASENRRLREVADAATEQARQDCITAGIPCTAEVVQEHYSVLAPQFAKRARIHDATIVDAEPDSLSLGRGLLEETLFGSGRPLVVVPKGTDTFHCRRIVIAWDGSARATRAVNDALPFLRGADQVEILSVSGEKDLSQSIAGAELAPHLVRHGVNCAVKDLASKDGDVGETIRTQAGLLRADLLVMGAFVHSRLRQLVLGGVTQSMLKSCPVPLLLSY